MALTEARAVSMADDDILGEGEALAGNGRSNSRGAEVRGTSEAGMALLWLKPA